MPLFEKLETGNNAEELKHIKETEDLVAEAEQDKLSLSTNTDIIDSVFAAVCSGRLKSVSSHSIGAPGEVIVDIDKMREEEKKDLEEMKKNKKQLQRKNFEKLEIKHGF